MADDVVPVKTDQPAPTTARRRPVWPWVVGAIGLALLALILLWDWDWFIPLVQRQASASLGRPVTIAHLHLRPGRITEVTADDVRIANPEGFPQDQDFARIARLRVDANMAALLRTRQIVLPLIVLDRLVINATALPDGRNNWALATSTGNGGGAPPRIGTLRISDGHAHVIYPRLRADFALAIATRHGASSHDDQIVVDADGTYAGQPVTGRFIGGALLSLRDPSRPYPVDLHLANGPTKLGLVGTVQDPMKFAGADLRLTASGPDMSLLYPLTGVPIPQTPPFTLNGKLDYADRKIRFSHFQGRMGSSDLDGEVDVDPTGERPVVQGDVTSHRVNLVDLGGFIGARPGPQAPPPPAQARDRLLPTTPINMPKLRAADMHIRYNGEHIEGRSIPLDSLHTVLDVVDGHVNVHPLDFAVGTGRIASAVELTPQGDQLRAKAHVDFSRLDLARIMQATHTFQGMGTIGGRAEIETVGNSVSTFMGNGNGELKLAMVDGGAVSALLIDLAGLQFGNSLLAALGLPNQTPVRCFVTDIALEQGIARTKVLLLDTGEARTLGEGTINFRDETLDYTLTTRAKHFTIGSLPGPVHIGGHLVDPTILPGAETAARAGAAAGLGALLTPLGALLPTIQFGIGEDNACTGAINEVRRPIEVPSPRAGGTKRTGQGRAVPSHR